MVLDAFRIDLGHTSIDADGQQEPVDDLVAFSARDGESSSLVGQSDRLAGHGLGETVAFESLDGADDRDVRDAESGGKVGDAAAIVGLLQLRDGLAIILRDLRRVVVAGSLVRG